LPVTRTAVFSVVLSVVVGKTVVTVWWGYCAPWPSWCVVGLLVSDGESEYEALVGR